MPAFELWARASIPKTEDTAETKLQPSTSTAAGDENDSKTKSDAIR